MHLTCTFTSIVVILFDFCSTGGWFWTNQQTELQVHCAAQQGQKYIVGGVVYKFKIEKQPLMDVGGVRRWNCEARTILALKMVCPPQQCEGALSNE